MASVFSGDMHLLKKGILHQEQGTIEEVAFETGTSITYGLFIYVPN